VTSHHLYEVLDRTRRRIEAEVRNWSDRELALAFEVARPFRRSIILEEHRRREARKKSVYDWLRNPAV
jgi:hypothetical protein